MRRCSTSLPLHLLPDTAAVADDGSLHDRRAARSPSSPPSSARRCSSTTSAHLRDRCREAVDAFGHQRAVYATKAFLCTAMARLAYEEGMLLDVASGGEMHVALRAGVPARRADAARQQQERRRAAHGDRPRACATSSSTASTSSIGSSCCTPRACPVPRVVLRITPGVHAHTHEFIATGQDDSKFGFNLGNGAAAAAVERARRSPAVELVGVHCHIGSNVFARRQLRQGGRGDGRLRRAARPARARARRRARRRLRRRRGGADDHRVGQRAARRVRCARRALADQRRARSIDRRRGGDHRLHGRHDQAHPGRAHVRRRRRRHERQPATGALRQRLRGVPAARRRRRAPDVGRGSSASTARAATC